MVSSKRKRNEARRRGIKTKTRVQQLEFNSKEEISMRDSQRALVKNIRERNDPSQTKRRKIKETVLKRNATNAPDDDDDSR